MESKAFMLQTFGLPFLYHPIRIRVNPSLISDPTPSIMKDIIQFWERALMELGDHGKGSVATCSNNQAAWNEVATNNR
jgi:hypothetical protein